MNTVIIMSAFIAILLIIVCVGYWIGGQKGMLIAMGGIAVLMGLIVVITSCNFIYQVSIGAYPPKI